MFANKKAPTKVEALKYIDSAIICIEALNL
jgi:hypothetical protein